MFIVLSVLFLTASGQGIILSEDAKSGHYKTLDSALCHLDSLIAIKPSKQLFIQRGDVYFYQYTNEGYRRAFDEYTKAMQLSTDSQALLLIRRGSAASMYDKELAFKDYSESIRIDSMAGGYGARATLLMFKKRYEDAINDYDKEIAILGDSMASVYAYTLWRGYAKYKLLRYNEALKDLYIATRYVANNGIAYPYIAATKRDMGQTKEACEDYKLAVYWGHQEYQLLVDKYCK